MKTKLQILLTASWFVAQAASAAPDPGNANAPAAANPAGPALAMADPAPRAHAAKENKVAEGGKVVNGPGVTLYHGEVQVLDLANVSRIAVGNGGVLRATVAEPGQVVLIGEGAGTTSLRVWSANGEQYSYEVTVRPDDTARIVRDVQDLLASEPGLSVKQIDGHVLIEGDYSSAQTAARVAAIQKIYPQVVSVAPAHQAPRTLPVERMIHMDVRVVEISKKVLENLGVNWAQQVSGPGVTLNMGSKNFPGRSAANGGLFGIATNLTSLLDLTEQAGDSWTLAEPKVSCKSGGEAKFTVGGEIPVPVAAGLGTSTVIYKKYGIILEFKPVADDKGNVTSTIVAEVSEPDPAFSNLNGNGLIAFRQNRTETEVSLKQNETLVISGLLRNSGTNSAVGIPGLKDVPVLGNLFKSRDYQNERTELVVMVTPRAVEIAGEANVAAIRQADDATTRVMPMIDAINHKLAE
jgi:pilus assembly protein CpaC